MFPDSVNTDSVISESLMPDFYSEAPCPAGSRPGDQALVTMLSSLRLRSRKAVISSASRGWAAMRARS